ncbi:hypothetical protein WHR41_03467 [Cladosporium halotolerans]|uniref:GrpE protein homolog, mitochondrial n=1 Tax=Cladosporium halotolerans TaxID=1052096 RepID=A0AB34KUF7_9PEZI
MFPRRFAQSLQFAAKQSAAPARIQRSAFISQQYAPAMSQRISGMRMYSDAPEAEAKKAEEGSAEKEEAKKEEDPVKAELEAKKKDLLEATDKLKHSIADFRNLQNQTKREVQAAKDFAIQRFAKDLMDSVDNLDRALANVPAEKLQSGNQDLVNLHDGLKMTETVLMQTLKKHGMERFDPSVDSEKFDPNEHEATFMAPQPGKEDGTVFFTQSKGFKLNGRVLRAPKVGVVKNS